LENQISCLLKIIRDEIELYRELIERAGRKTDLPAQDFVEDLPESIRADEICAAKLRSLEIERARFCLDLCRLFRIPQEEFTLIKLAGYLEQPLALEVTTQATLFLDAVTQLKSINERNRKLVEKCLGYSQGLLALFFNSMSSYRQTGLFEPMLSVQPTFSQSA
jgi:hypothetical protein